uniref:TOG domain-containing protein n=1 Tax=Ditylenchus dipsaci TaxID=166011 RepID=A0A915DMZ1_9BILA
MTEKSDVDEISGTETDQKGGGKQPNVDLWQMLDPVDALSNAHYGQLVDALKKVLEKDANINVASVAAKCLTGICQGLRKKFSAIVPSLAPALFDKFKEKKPFCVIHCFECVDVVCATTRKFFLAKVHIVVAISKPNPDIKKQMDLLLYRLIRDIKPDQMPKKLSKELMPILAKHTADPDAEVRDASCAALGAIMKCIGQKAALAMFSTLVTDKTKISRIEEFWKKAIEESDEC